MERCEQLPGRKTLNAECAGVEAIVWAQVEEDQGYW
jgi:hypothetical protein